MSYIKKKLIQLFFLPTKKKQTNKQTKKQINVIKNLQWTS